MSFSRLGRKLYTLLASRRLGAACMIMWVVLFGLSLLIPQWPDFTHEEFAQLLARHGAPLRIADHLGLTDIYRSWAMMAVFALFAANLWLSFANRLGALKHETDLRRAKMSGRHATERTAFAATEGSKDLKRLAGILQKRRFKVAVNEKGLSAVRNRYSVAGSVLFHLSFFLLLIALALRMLTYFHGVAVLGEGEQFTGQPWSYVRATPKRMNFEDMPKVGFTLKDIAIDYDEHDNLLDAAAVIRPHTADAATHQTIRVNYPYRLENTSVRLVDYGIAPVFTVRETDKRLEHRAGIRLMAFPPGREDSFQFPELDTEFRIMFFPSYHEEDGPSSRYRDITNPAAVVAFTTKDGTPHELTLGEGEWARAGNLLLKLDEVRYWGRFEINRDLGRVPLYIGLFLAFVGLCWRMFLTRARIDARLQEKDGRTMLQLTGKADYTREPFATEFADIIKDLNP